MATPIVGGVGSLKRHDETGWQCSGFIARSSHKKENQTAKSGTSPAGQTKKELCLGRGPVREGAWQGRRVHIGELGSGLERHFGKAAKCGPIKFGVLAAGKKPPLTPPETTSAALATTSAAVVSDATPGSSRDDAPWTQSRRYGRALGGRARPQSQLGPPFFFFLTDD